MGLEDSRRGASSALEHGTCCPQSPHAALHPGASARGAVEAHGGRFHQSLPGHPWPWSAPGPCPHHHLLWRSFPFERGECERCLVLFQAAKFVYIIKIQHGGLTLILLGVQRLALTLAGRAFYLSSYRPCSPSIQKSSCLIMMQLKTRWGIIFKSATENFRGNPFFPGASTNNTSNASPLLKGP